MENILVPKRVHKIDGFHGGLNNSSDPRDIADNELSSATDVSVDKLGVVRNIGEVASHGTVQSPAAATIAAGYGLFTFGHDKDNGQSSGGSSGSDVPCEYLLIQDSSGNADISIYNGGSNGDDTTGTGAGSWGEARIDLGTGSGAKAVFYSVDGAVRVCDSQHSSLNSTPKWYGYIDKLLYDKIPSRSIAIEEGGTGYTNPSGDSLTFASGDSTNWLDGSGDYGVYYPGGVINSISISYMGGGYESAGALNANPDGSGSGATLIGDGNDYLDSINGWYSLDSEIASPTYGSISTTAPSPTHNGWNLNITTPADSSSTWIADTYQIAFSLVYDGNQESLLYIPTSNHTFTVTDGDSVRMSAYMENLSNSSGLSKRVIGGRAYFKVLDSDEEWKLLCDMSVFKGLRSGFGSDDWATWGEYASNDLKTSDSTTSTHLYRICESISMNADTYISINGYSPDEISISNNSYKTATVASRTVYVGNVRRKDENGNIVIHGDAIYKSMPGKFDVFPGSRKVEVNIRDGEDIVALESFADRILQFKNRTLHIINISSEYEFLEDTHAHKGVLSPSAVVKTDYGVVWANNLGCYFYDGRTVKNLLEKDGRRVISDSIWQDFFTRDGMVGYLPKKRQVVVVKDSSATSDGDCYLYDMVTKSWVHGDSKFNDGTLKTNFIVDWNNDLVYSYDSIGTPVIAKWDSDSAASSNISLITKDIDLGQPSVRKKVYKVYITYKTGSATNVQVKYAVDGDTTFDKVFADGTNFTSNVLDNAGSGDWTQAILKPNTSSESNSIYSFALKLSATGTGAEVTRVKCVADSSDSLNGKYFDIYGAGGKTEVWIDTDDSGTSAPSGSGSYAQTIEVTEIETDDSAEAVAIAVAEAVGDHANFTTKVEGDTVIITDAASASRTDASDGDTGFAITVDKQGGTNSVPATFEINDISIIYRMKNVK